MAKDNLSSEYNDIMLDAVLYEEAYSDVDFAKADAVLDNLTDI